MEVRPTLPWILSDLILYSGNKQPVSAPPYRENVENVMVPLKF